MIVMTRPQSKAVAELIRDHANISGAISVEQVTSEVLKGTVGVHFTTTGSKPDVTFLVNDKGVSQKM